MEDVILDEELIEEEIEYKPIEIYYYERKTREYLGSDIAKTDPEETRRQGKFVPLLSAFSTLIQPPEFKENQIPVYHSHVEEQTITTQEPVYDEAGKITDYEEKNETVKVLIENWTIEKDLRKNFYIVDENLNVNGITIIGEIEGIIVPKELGDEIKKNPENYKIENNAVVKKSDEEIKKEKEQKERNRIAKLSLTAAVVERALYKDKGIDFDDVINLVNEYNLNQSNSDPQIQSQSHSELVSESLPTSAQNSIIDQKA